MARPKPPLILIIPMREPPVPQAVRRNPMLALPAVHRLATLDHTTRQLVREILLDLKADARARAEASWRKHKAPMAAYWAAVAVYAGHFARLLR